METSYTWLPHLHFQYNIELGYIERWYCWLRKCMVFFIWKLIQIQKVQGLFENGPLHSTGTDVRINRSNWSYFSTDWKARRGSTVVCRCTHIHDELFPALFVWLCQQGVNKKCGGHPSLSCDHTTIYPWGNSYLDLEGNEVAEMRTVQNLPQMSYWGKYGLVCY